MNIFDGMLARNREFAAQESITGKLVPSLPDAIVNLKALIIGCVDMRVDPAHVLGLQSGEAVVLRNIGGRITPSLVEQIGLLGRINQVLQRAPNEDGEFHLVVLHHTDCGISRLAGDPARLAHFFEIEKSRLGSKAVSDPRTAVALDIEYLRSVSALPAAWLVSGLVYDVATGLLEVVVAPIPLGTNADAHVARFPIKTHEVTTNARLAMTWKKNRPEGVPVSMESVRLLNWTPSFWSSPTRSTSCLTLRPSRSSFQTIKVSPGAKALPSLSKTNAFPLGFRSPGLRRSFCSRPSEAPPSATQGFDPELRHAHSRSANPVAFAPGFSAILFAGVSSQNSFSWPRTEHSI